MIGTLFKLYPWEDLLADDYARHIAGSGCMFLEPAWKAVVSNKGLLPVLWEMFEGHPNLLPAFFADDVAPALVENGQPDPSVAQAFGRVATSSAPPMWSSRSSRAKARASSSSRTARSPRRRTTMITTGMRGSCRPITPCPNSRVSRPVIGAWIVGDACAGIGIREDRARITQDLSRFKPHFIAG